MADDWKVIAVAIIGYSVVSLTVVYFNWWFFTKGFRFPVFVSWIQQIVGLVLFYSGSKAALYFGSIRPIFPPTENLSFSTVRLVSPLSATFVLTVGLSNMCLQHTLISTYQVARSLTTLFALILSYIVLREKQTIVVIVAVGLMVFGFMIGSLDPSTLSLPGLLAGGSSSFFQALYSVLIKRCLPHANNDNQLLLFYNVLLSSILFIPMVLVYEDTISWKQVIGRDPQGPKLYLIWGGMILSGLLGTTLNMSQYMIVSLTSPLTMNIVGLVKSFAQTVGGIVFFGDAVTTSSGVGILLSLFGSTLYVRSKHAQSLELPDQKEVVTEMLPISDQKTTEDEF